MLYPVLAVLMVASVGGGYQTVRQSIDTRAYPMPGQLVDVGGHRMHLYCTGSGSPTVVLEPGQGGASSDLGWVAPVVARDSRVCVYDRAGRGWSDAADGPQDAAHRCPGPTCWPVTPSAACTSKPSPPIIPTRSPAWCSWTPPPPNRAPLPARTESYSVFGRVSTLLPAVAHLGAGRLIVQASYGSLPPHFRGEARANASTAPYLRSWIEEFVAANTSMQQAAALTNLDGKPLVVVTADTGNVAGWEQAQDKCSRRQPLDSRRS